MKRIVFVLVVVAMLPLGLRAQQNNRYVKIETQQGWCIVKLYNETPVHRDNFIKLVNSGYFNKTTFNRIIKDFVIQGGDPDSLYEKSHVLKPEQFWLAPEFDSTLYHKRGAIAMGRDENLTLSSFTTQFYIVDGKQRTSEQLDTIAKRHHITFNEAQRKMYMKMGGTPNLDQHYTVFGEIVKGINLIDKLTAVKVDHNGNPDIPVWMKLKLLTPKEAAKALK
jgi:cyclophilin family peptidyl-prolyl cis-trans isomerase